MPAKSNRNGRNKKDKSRVHGAAPPVAFTSSGESTSAQPSPAPRQLPTPLPELELEIAGFQGGIDEGHDAATQALDDGLSPASDVDMEDLQRTHRVQGSDVASPLFSDRHGHEDEDPSAAYRSPPFREALLLSEDESVEDNDPSMSPLPIRPRIFDDVEGKQATRGVVGHGRPESHTGRIRSPPISPRSGIASAFAAHSPFTVESSNDIDSPRQGHAIGHRRQSSAGWFADEREGPHIQHTAQVSRPTPRAVSPPTSPTPLSPRSGIASAFAARSVEPVSPRSTQTPRSPIASLSRTIRAYSPFAPASPALPAVVSRGEGVGSFASGAATALSYGGYEEHYDSRDDDYQQELRTGRVGLGIEAPQRQRAWNNASTEVRQYGRPGPLPTRPLSPTRPIRGHRTTKSVGGEPFTYARTQDARAGRARSSDSRIGGGGEVDKVKWARWQRIGEQGHKRLLLVIGYTTSLQIWDTTDFGSVKEILNVDTSELGGSLGAIDARCVPVRNSEAQIALLLRQDSLDGTLLALYSLKTHSVLSKVAIAGDGRELECNAQYIVVSTSAPPALHIFAADSLTPLHSIPSAQLAAFAHQSTRSNQPSYIPLAASTVSIAESILYKQEASPPKPVFSLNGRLLAYAVPSNAGPLSQRRGSGSSGTSGPSPSSIASASSPFSLPSLPTLGTLPSLSGISSMGISEISKQVGTKIPTQEELGNAALRVGSAVGNGVWGGMRFLGGKAVEAAKSRMGVVDSPPTLARSTSVGSASALRASRSAPGSDGGRLDDMARRRFSSMALSPIEASVDDISQQPPTQKSVIPPLTKVLGQKGYMVRVVDLSALLRGGAPEKGVTPTPLVAFVGSRSQPIAHLQFAPDGCSLFVVPKDGQVTKVFRLAPAPPSSLSRDGLSSPAPTPSSSLQPGGGVAAPEVQPQGTATHLYDLRRGISAAVVDHVEVLEDGLLAAVTTRNRTVHVFPVNPCGGRPDVESHLVGKVRNSSLAPVHKVHQQSLVRIRGARTLAATENDVHRDIAELAFTFIHPTDNVALPPSMNSPARLGPHPSALDIHSAGAPSSSSSTSPSHAMMNSPLRPPAPAAPRTATNAPHAQDALLFDPLDGKLYLQRVMMGAKAVRDGHGAVGAPGTSLSSVSTSLTSGFASISIPGMGGAGPLSRSVSSSLSERSNPLVGGGSGVSGGGGGGVGRKATGVATAEDTRELVAHVGVVAMWDLQKGTEWGEIRVPVHIEGRDRRRAVKDDSFLAHSELSTFSTSRRILPRPIYLVHQFSFHDLGEDYHALIRSYRFNVPSTKIEVRKDIPVQAFATSPIQAQGTNTSDEQFLDTFNSSTSVRGTRHAASSFDEPLASALSGEMEFARSSVPEGETVLPMYPNGVAGQRGALPFTLPSSIPIKLAADGVSQGLGRLRRGIANANANRRARQQLSNQGAGAIGEEEMSFEFDEEEGEDDFMSMSMVPSSRAGGGGGGKSGSSTTTTTTTTITPVKGSLANSLQGSLDNRDIMDGDVVGHVDEEIWGQGGWDMQDRQAVEEEETFHSISRTVLASPPPSAAGGAHRRASLSSTAKLHSTLSPPSPAMSLSGDGVAMQKRNRKKSGHKPVKRK